MTECFEIIYFLENLDKVMECVVKWCRVNDDTNEYLVKWKDLPYDECHWEQETDISAFQAEIERFNKFQSRTRKVLDASESENLQKEFLQYESSPGFLSGGMYFDYSNNNMHLIVYSDLD